MIKLLNYKERRVFIFIGLYGYLLSRSLQKNNPENFVFFMPLWLKKDGFNNS